jgi:hypothetical protein
MKNTAELRAELEQDLTWRVDELRSLQNRVSYVTDEDEQKRLRRPLVLLLYAHYEGFCKFALALYVQAINSALISCGQANYAVAAASLSSVFKELRNPSKKNDIFRHDLPGDAKLHSFAREREFMERLDEVSTKKVEIPDNAIDTESNLKPVVLRKNLYMVGLTHDLFDSFESEIQQLVRFRNEIGHGETKEGVELRTYERLAIAAFRIMSAIVVQVTEAIEQRRYLRK